MKFEEVSWFSNRVNKNMRIKIYGHYGISIIIFPSLNKQSDDFSNNGVINALSNYIEEGKIKLFCLDGVDEESVTLNSFDNEYKSYKLDMYHEYVINEVLPFIYDNNQGFTKPLVMGCSMGATHAAINFFRRPELFMGIFAMSGRYDLLKFFGNYMNDNIYKNSPNDFLKNMNNDHPYINEYNSKRMIFVCGQGSFEYLVLSSNQYLKKLLNEKGINAWFDILGEDNIHDWCSWINQMHHYLHYFLE